MIESAQGVKPPNIIFLEIDGVLYSPRMETVRREMVFTGHEFDPVAIALLNRLCREQNAKIVLTSFRAHQWSPHQNDVREEMRAAGFKGEFHDDWHIEQSNTMIGKSRAIAAWCDKHDEEFDDYIIIAPDFKNRHRGHSRNDYQYMNAEQKERCILTSPSNGLLLENFIHAERLLAGQGVSGMRLRVKTAQVRESGGRE